MRVNDDDMRNAWKQAQGWRSALVALLAFVMSVAPLAAQVVMATSSHASHGHANAHNRSHDHSDHQSVAGHHHEGAAADRSADHGHDHAALADHDHNGTTGSQHDHGTGPDSNCCGTYCHSACAIAAMDGVLNARVVGTYARPPSTSAASFDPDQLQRPPSVLLSV